MENVSKDNYIEWIELMIGLSNEERNKLENEDIRACRMKYKMTLLSHSEQLEEVKTRGRKSAIESYFIFLIFV
jgi:peroxiredoxin family protein